MIRKKKLYKRPMKIYQAGRIKEENELVKKYGLKNKLEIWKTQAKVNYFRSRAKELAKKSLEEQEVLFGKLRAIGLKINNTADVLDLKVEDLLDRRLSTIAAKNKVANTTKQARQMIVHKRILVKGKVVSSPSYLVPVPEEDKITIKSKSKKPKAEKVEEVKQEMNENVEGSSKDEIEESEEESENE